MDCMTNHPKMLCHKTLLRSQFWKSGIWAGHRSSALLCWRTSGDSAGPAQMAADAGAAQPGPSAWGLGSPPCAGCRMAPSRLHLGPVLGWLELLFPSRKPLSMVTSGWSDFYTELVPPERVLPDSQKLQDSSRSVANRIIIILLV